MDTALVGETTYDLQSNAAMGRRVHNHGDGTISVVWTTSGQLNNDVFPDRGTGYNYFDGSSWTNGIVTSRIEQDYRTGWPSIGTYNGFEYIMAHSPNEINESDPGTLGDERGGFVLNQNSSIGRSNWMESNWLALSEAYNPNDVQDGPKGPIWYRADNTGPLVHMIGAYSDTGFYAPNPQRPGDSIRRPMVYSRFNLDNDTFEVVESYLPDYGERLFDGDPDAYSMDARDSVVVIVAGGAFFKSVTLWRSNDSGQTFRRVLVDTFPEPRRARDNSITFDTTRANDGNVNVVLDRNNNAHVFYGSRLVLDNNPQDESFQFFPNSFGMVYWNDIPVGTRTDTVGFDVDTIIDDVVPIFDTTYFTEQVPVYGPKRLLLDFEDFDLNDNGQRDVGSRTDTIPNGGARYSQSTAISFPNAGVDEDNHIYLTYSQVIEGGADFQISGQNFRDLFVIYSTDQGENWSEPVNLTNTRQTEEVYNSVATEVDDFIHLLFMSDDEPGTNLTNGDAIDFNSMIYARINTDSLKAGRSPVGLDQVTQHSTLTSAEIFPNPVEDYATLQLNLEQAGPVEVAVSDLMGRQIRHETARMGRGLSRMRLERGELETGIYLVEIRTRGERISKRMVVR